MRLRLLLCLAVQALCIAVNGLHAQTSVQRRVDSLNEAAFALKRSHVNEAFHLLATAEQLALQEHYQRGLATTYLYEGGIFQQSGYPKKALALYYQSLNISRDLKDLFNTARANQQIAAALKDDGEIDSAEELLKQITPVYRQLHKANDLVNLQNSLGLIYIDKKNWNNAFALFDSAARAGKASGYRYGEKKAYYNLGLLYKLQQQTEKAVSFFNASIALSDSMHDAYGSASANIQLAGMALAASRLDDCLGYASRARAQAESVDALQLQGDAIQLMIDVYKRRGQKDELVQWQDKMIALQQKMYNTDKSYAAGFINMIKSQEFKNQQAMQQVADVKQTANNQQLLLLIVGVLLLLLLLMGIPIYFNYKKASMLSQELTLKSSIIEKNAAALDQLNKAISRQNQKLEEENKLKDKLISIISHDLRHPLVNTRAILDLINLKLVSPKETEELLEQLEGQYIRSLSLLDNLLFWIRAQMRGMKIAKTPVNMHQLINTIIEEQRVPLQIKNIRVVNQTDGQLEWLAEREMLKIIFRNLLSNAAKFTPADGCVYFSSVLDDGKAYILVRDTGIGMTKEIIEKISNRQYFSSKGTANEKGSGFGLILVQELLDKHQSELLIESGPGKGSVFAVKFPV